MGCGRGAARELQASCGKLSGSGSWFSEVQWPVSRETGGSKRRARGDHVPDRAPERVAYDHGHARLLVPASVVAFDAETAFRLHVVEASGALNG